MSIIKYKANTGYTGRNKPVEIVKCEKESESYVWIDGRKEAKECQYHAYFDALEQAIDHLTSSAQKEVDRWKSNLDHALNEQKVLLEILSNLKLETNDN